MSLISILSAPRKNSTSPMQIFLIGIFMFIIAIPLAATGIVALSAVGGFLFLVSLILMLAGYVGNQDRKKKLRKQMQMYPGGYPYPQQIIIQAPPTQTSTSHSEVTREIVKVRCRHCNSLNFETSARCSNCGANM